MPGNENLNQNEKNIEGAEVEEWRIHAVARQLEEAMHFEARPEFNAELRSRLLSEIKAGKKDSSRQSKNRNRRNWPPFLAFPGWQSALSPMLATVLLLAGLAILINLNISTTPAPLQATATASPVAESEENSDPTNSSVPVTKPEADSKATLTDDGYWDDFLIRSQLNRSKKDSIASATAKQVREFDKRFKNGPLPVP